MKKSRGILSLIVAAALIVLLGFTTIVGFGKGHTGSMKNIKLGLDLAGGVSITYQVKDDNPSDEEMSDTIYKLQKRVEVEHGITLRSTSRQDITVEKEARLTKQPLLVIQ